MSNSSPVVSLPDSPSIHSIRSVTTSSHPEDPIVVVGNGPVGMRSIEEIKRNQPDAAIVLFGEEPGDPYNRVQLSALLAGETTESQIQKPVKDTNGTRLVTHFGCRVTSIDRDNKRVRDEFGRHQAYSKLILATGSRPRRLAIAGMDIDGVSTFRTIHDVANVISRCNRGEKFVVIGGGLLGLEIAWGISRHHAPVTVVEFADRLLSRQLDQAGAQRLRSKIEQAGIEIVTDTGVEEILGTSTVHALRLSNGDVLSCDSVIIATGIEPNIDLATAAQLDTDKGIIVNNSMQTSDDSIYAVGECSEHDGRVYGLVAPGVEQARVLGQTVKRINTIPAVQYRGSNESSYLKVAGNPVFSATPATESTCGIKSYAFTSDRHDVYRRIYLRERRLAGAIGIGAWQETTKIRHAIDDERLISTFELLRFRLTGSIWADGAVTADDLAEDEIVCHCMAVSKKSIQSLIDDGVADTSVIARKTGASTVCGSCKPLILSLQGQGVAVGVTRQQILLRCIVAISSLLLIALALAPPVPLAQSAQNWPWWDALWRDSFNRQLSGFALVAFTVSAAAIGARKRLALFQRWGDFSGWRIVHLLLGSGFVLCLIVHTGFRFGHGLDRLLLINFIVALVAGVITSIGHDRHVSAPTSHSIRNRQNLNLLHIATLWPIPVVLGWHVFKSYWY